MSALHKSMEKFGYLTPIVIDQNNMIADGEHRALVYKQHGLEEIPAFKINLKTDADRRMLRQVMNKLRGEHDRELDANELVAIFQAGQLDNLTQLIAQDKNRLESMIRFFRPEVLGGTLADDQMDAIEQAVRANPVCKAGDKWQLGNNIVVCHDNMEALKTIDSNSVDLTVTSPPYDDIRDYHGYVFEFERTANQLYRIMRPGGVVVWIVSDKTVEGSRSLASFEQAIYFKKIGFKVHDVMIYVKTGSTPARWKNKYNPMWEFMFILSKDEIAAVFNPIEDKENREAGKLTKTHPRRQKDGTIKTRYLGTVTPVFGTRGNVWPYGTGWMVSSPDEIAFEHPSVFPEDLARDQIISWSNRGMSVLDPFLGSGTTLKAAEMTGRKCTGIEISPIYCDIAIKRWEMYTGKKAVKL